MSHPTQPVTASVPPGARTAAAPRMVGGYTVAVHYHGRDQQFVVVAADIAQAASLAQQRLRERSTDGRVLSVRFLGDALVG